MAVARSVSSKFSMAFIGALLLSGCATTGAPAPEPVSYSMEQAGVMTTASGLKYKILSPGEGEQRPVSSDTVLIAYEGRLLDESVFDKGEDALFPVSAVVPGFSESLQLMRKGARYRVWIPPELGYGARGAGEAVPPDSWLIFDITLRDFMDSTELQRRAAEER